MSDCKTQGKKICFKKGKWEAKKKRWNEVRIKQGKRKENKGKGK